jgi:type VI secretion system protein ImpC
MEPVNEKQEKRSEMGKQTTSDSLVDQLLAKVDSEYKLTVKEQTPEELNKSSEGRLLHSIQALIGAIAETQQPVEKVDKVLIDAMIAQIDCKLSDQLNEIMHHEDFQKMESSWKGLNWTVAQTNFRKNIKVEVLNCPKEKLNEDFEDSDDPVQSGLYKQMYTHEYDMFGAHPFSAMIADYEFNRSPGDISLLQNVSKVAAATHCPFISSVGARFLVNNLWISFATKKPLMTCLGCLSTPNGVRFANQKIHVMSD